MKKRNFIKKSTRPSQENPNGGIVEKKNLYSHESFICLIGLAILVVLPVIIRKIKLLKNKNKNKF